MDIEIRHLRLVRAVATQGGLTSAGRVLHVSQSALSHQLRDVEQRLGTRLFLRVGKRMLITAAGERLLRLAEGMLAALDRTEAAIKQLSDGRHGRLRLAASQPSDFHWLPPVLLAYRRIYPSVDVHIVANGGTDAATLLLDGLVDVAVMTDPLTDSRVTTRVLRNDDIVAVVERSSGLSRRNALRLADLAGHRLLIDRPLASHVLGAHLGEGRLRVAGVQVVEQSDAIVELVSAKLGIALVPRWSVDAALKSAAAKAIRLVVEGAAVTWHAAVLKDVAEVSVVSQFVDLMVSQASASAVHHSHESFSPRDAKPSRFA